MDREQIKNLIAGYVREGRITKAELLSAYDEGAGSEKSTYANEFFADKPLPKTSNFTVSNILFALGAGIVVLGIVILVANNWESIGDMGKILVTLGVAFLSYMGGLLLEHGESTSESKNHKIIIGVASSMHIIGAILFPIGIFTTLDLTGINIDSLQISFYVSLGLFLLYTFTAFLFRRNLLGLSAVVFGTWAYYATLAYIIDSKGVLFNNVLTYSTGLLGIAFLLLGYAFLKGSFSKIVSLLYSSGCISLLGSIIYLGGDYFSWSDLSIKDLFWNVFFIPVISIIFVLSAKLRSSVILSWASFFLVVYISKITSQYFRESLGWPLTLVIIGFALIAIAVGAIKLGKTFKN